MFLACFTQKWSNESKMLAHKTSCKFNSIWRIVVAVDVEETSLNWSSKTPNAMKTFVRENKIVPFRLKVLSSLMLINNV